MPPAAAAVFLPRRSSTLVLSLRPSNFMMLLFWIDGTKIENIVGCCLFVIR